MTRAALLAEKPDHGADLGPAFQTRVRAGESEIVSLEAVSRSTVAPGTPIQVRRMTVECVLDRLLVNTTITAPQWRAGMLFRAKWMASVKPAIVVASYGESTGRASQNPTDEAAARRATASSDVTEAIRVLGMIRSAAVIAVCGQDEAAKGRLVALKDGLDVLRVYFKVPADYERAQTRGK